MRFHSFSSLFVVYVEPDQLLIIIIITRTIFIVLSSLPRDHCESPLRSFDGCRIAPSGRRSSDLATWLGLWVRIGCYPLQPPSPFTTHYPFLILGRWYHRWIPGYPFSCKRQREILTRKIRLTLIYFRWTEWRYQRTEVSCWGLFDPYGRYWGGILHALSSAFLVGFIENNKDRWRWFSLTCAVSCRTYLANKYMYIYTAR